MGIVIFKKNCSKTIQSFNFTNIAKLKLKVFSPTASVFIYSRT